MLDPARSEARLSRGMLLIAAAGMAGLFIAGRGRAGLGFAIGAFFGVLNYHWLRESVEALGNAGTVRPPKRVIVKFAIRYPLVILALYLLYRTRWLPFMAIIYGLLVPAGAILIESPFLIREGLRASGRD
jgi:ATP synthase I chain